MRTAEDIQAITAQELLTTYVPADVHHMLTYWDYEPDEDQYGWQHDAAKLGGVLWLQRTHDGRLRTYDESTNEFYIGTEAADFVADTVAALRVLG